MFDPSLMVQQGPNPGERFAQAFQQGMARNAIAALAMNPNDPRAQQGAAPYAPQQVMQARQRQADLTAEERQAWVKTLGEAAKMADTPQKRDQIVDYFIQQGHPEAAQFKQIPPEQWPGVRAALMAQGGVADDKPAQDPGIIREFDIARSRGLISPDTKYEDFMRMRNPGMSAPVTIPYGATVETGGGPPAPITATGPNGAKVQYNPQSGQWEPMGGTSGNAGGGFPQ